MNHERDRIHSWKLIEQLRRRGWTYRAIAQALGCQPSTVHYACKQLGLGSKSFKPASTKGKDEALILPY